MTIRAAPLCDDGKRLPFFWAAVTLLAVAAGPAWAERTQVYSIQGVDCGDCGDQIKSQLKQVKGARKAAFDIHKVELTVRLDDGLADAAILAAVERAGFKAVVGPGQGAYLPTPTYPDGADVVKLTDDGSAVGALEKLRAPAKYTVFDIYAEWCGPCRVVDARLREIVAVRKDVAVRKLNVVDFDRPLARELGPGLRMLPYLVVFSPEGKRTDIAGLGLQKLESALSVK